VSGGDEAPMRNNGAGYIDVFWMRIEFALDAGEADALVLADYLNRARTSDECETLAIAVQRTAGEAIGDLLAKRDRLREAESRMN
jgi:hypothetical protein